MRVLPTHYPGDGGQTSARAARWNSRGLYVSHVVVQVDSMTGTLGVPAGRGIDPVAPGHRSNAPRLDSAR